MTGDPHQSAGGPPPEILRRGRGYDAEPPVTLRSQVLRRRPPIEEQPQPVDTEDFPATTDDLPAAAKSDAETSAPHGDGQHPDDAAVSKRTPASSAETRRLRREQRLQRRREQRAQTAALAPQTETDAGSDEPTAETDSPWRGRSALSDWTDAPVDPVVLDHRFTARPVPETGESDHLDRDTGTQSRTWTRLPRHVVAVAARHKGLLLALVAGATVLAVLLGVTAGALVGRGSGDDGPATDPAAAMATPDPTSDAVECPSRQDGATTTGRDPGNQTSGPNAIKAFNWGYYQWRSGTAARAVVAANGKVGTAIALQQWIDVLDPKLRYCLAITDKGNNVYDVEQTLFPSGGDRQVIRQDVTVTLIGGKYWIAAIKSKQ